MAAMAPFAFCMAPLKETKKWQKSKDHIRYHKCSPCYPNLSVICLHGERSFHKTLSAFSTPSFFSVNMSDTRSGLLTLAVGEAFVKLFQHFQRLLSYVFPVPSGRLYDNTRKRKKKIHITKGLRYTENMVMPNFRCSRLRVQDQPEHSPEEDSLCPCGNTEYMVLRR